MLNCFVYVSSNVCPMLTLIFLSKFQPPEPEKYWELTVRLCWELPEFVPPNTLYVPHTSSEYASLSVKPIYAHTELSGGVLAEAVSIPMSETSITESKMEPNFLIELISSQQIASPYINK